MNTYIIANGGCGERLTSVLMMLYQCGFYGIQNPINGVLIVDNDTTNPGKVYLETFIREINSMNAAIRRPYPPIQSPSWSPMVAGTQSMGALGRTGAELAALSLISTREELEQIIENKGFAGHVNIGVTIVNAALETEENKRIFEGFLNWACPMDGGTQARFIVVGSTHGGTGASLNTAIAERIRRHYQGHDNIVEIYGLFMLSYYSIPEIAGGGEESGNKLHISPYQFRPSDIEALEGYRGKDLVNGTFNNILFCGYDPRERTNLKHKEGGNDQDNKFSVAELLMCTGAYFIFAPNHLGVPQHEYLGINLTNNYDGRHLCWHNIPYSDRLQRCLARMGLFACSMSEPDDTLVGSWGSLLIDNHGSMFNSLYYIQKKNFADERPVFFGIGGKALSFINRFWNMLFQFSTNVDGRWNENVVLFKREAFERYPNPAGFQWSGKNTDVDSTIIFFGNSLQGRIPALTALDAEFRQALKDNPAQVATASRVEDRGAAYFAALFRACDKTYGLGE